MGAAPFPQVDVLGVALPGHDEQRPERRHDQEPVGDRHVGGDAAGDGPQHEPRRHGGEVDDGDLLQPQAVGEGDGGVEGEEPGDPGGAPGGGGAGADDQEADADHRAVPTGTTPAATARSRLRGWRRSASTSSGVVDEVGAARDEAPGGEGAEDGQDVLGGDREAGRPGSGEDEDVLDPLPGPGGPQQAAGQRVLPAGRARRPADRALDERGRRREGHHRLDDRGCVGAA